MPLFFVATAKSALLLGATIGVAAAVLSNDRVIEFAANSLQKGADRLYERLNNKRHKVKTHGVSLDARRQSERDTVSELTTPSHSDEEGELIESEEELYSCNTMDSRAKLTRYGKSSPGSLSIHSLD